MLRVGHEEPGAVVQLPLLVDDHQPFRPLLLQPYHLSEDPIRLLFPMATFACHGPETLRGLCAYLSCHRIDTPPPPLPVDVPRALDLADPMLAPARNQAGQFNGQHPSVKGRVGLREMPLGLSRADDLDAYLCPLPIAQPMEPMVQ
jgi:hypothetical protein